MNAIDDSIYPYHLLWINAAGGGQVDKVVASEREGRGFESYHRPSSCLLARPLVAVPPS